MIILRKIGGDNDLITDRLVNDIKFINNRSVVMITDRIVTMIN